MMTSMHDIELRDNVEPQVVGVSNSGLCMRNGAGTDSAQDNLIQGVQQQHLTEREHQWAFGLVLTSSIDLLASGVIIFVAFKYAYRDNGVSLYCLRFKSELSSKGIDQDLLRGRRRATLVREQVLSITMAIVMLISCVALLFKAMRKFKFWDKWYLDHKEFDDEVEKTTEWLAWVGFAVY